MPNTILVLKPGADRHDLARVAGVRPARIVEDHDRADPRHELLYFPILGVAVAPWDCGENDGPIADDSPILAAARERTYHLAEQSGPETGPDSGPATEGESAPPFPFPQPLSDGPAATWGLIACGAAGSKFTGRGAKVAVLDTGFDGGHPDYAGRDVRVNSLIPGEGPDDRHGHGTHCAGTACGGVDPQGRRYGVAPGAILYAGKVFPDHGFATDTTILSGIEWALRERCHVVSLSLGSPSWPGRHYHAPYEVVGRRALDLGCILVAAAGNDSRRPGFVAPVSSPADSPSILAVAALDPALRVAAFSNGAVNLDGGKIDIAAPGVNVYSSLPGGSHGFMTGTSQATPHVAGLLALWHEASGKTGRDLWNQLAAAVMARGRRGPDRVEDVGFGLAFAPPS